MEREIARLTQDFAAKVAQFIDLKAARLATDAILKAFDPNGRNAQKPGTGGATIGKRRGRPTKLAAARMLQGQYLGRLKKLSGGARDRVKAMAKNHSVADAVKLADKILARGAKN